MVVNFCYGVKNVNDSDERLFFVFDYICASIQSFVLILAANMLHQRLEVMEVSVTEAQYFKSVGRPTFFVFLLCIFLCFLGYPISSIITSYHTNFVPAVQFRFF